MEIPRGKNVAIWKPSDEDKKKQGLADIGKYDKGLTWYRYLKEQSNKKLAYLLKSKQYKQCCEQGHGFVVAYEYIENGKRALSYATFPSYVEFYYWMHNYIPENKRHFHEVYISSKSKEVRLFFDLEFEYTLNPKTFEDVKLNEYDMITTNIKHNDNKIFFNNEDINHLLGIIITTIKHNLAKLTVNRPDIFDVYDKINDVRLHILTSSRDYKYSFHIIAPDISFISMENMKEFCNLVKNDVVDLMNNCYVDTLNEYQLSVFPDLLLAMIDVNPYKSTQNLRMYGCSKPTYPNDHFTLVNYDDIINSSVYDGQQNKDLSIFEETIITMQNNLIGLIDLDVDEKQTSTYDKYDLDENTIKEVIEIVNTYKYDNEHTLLGYKFNLTNQEGSLISLTRTNSSYCPIHNRVHDSIGAFITVSKSGYVYFHCSHLEKVEGGNSIKIGQLKAYQHKISPFFLQQYFLRDLEENYCPAYSEFIDIALKPTEMAWAKFLHYHLGNDVVSVDQKCHNIFYYKSNTALWSVWEKSLLNNIAYELMREQIKIMLKIIDNEITPKLNLLETDCNEKRLIMCVQTKDTVGKMRTKLEMWSCNIGTKRILDNIVSLFLPYTYDPTFLTKLSSNKYLIPVKNKLVIDCEKSITEARERVRTDYIFSEFNVEFDPTVPTDDGLALLNLLMLDNKEMVDYLIRIFGSCFTGYVDDKAFYIFYGPRANNGKSTILEIVSYILGSEYAKPIPTHVLKGGSEAEKYQAECITKRLVIINEPTGNTAFDSTFLKSVAGKDDAIIGRALFKMPVSFVPQFKLFITCNECPNINVNDKGNVKRIRLIPFNAEFVQQASQDDIFEKNENTNFSAEFKNDKCKIQSLFNLLLKGAYDVAHRVREKIPSIMSDVAKTYTRDNDLIQEFIDEIIIFPPKCKDADETRRYVMNNTHKGNNNAFDISYLTPSAEIKERYSRWCNERNSKYNQTYFFSAFQNKMGTKYKYGKSYKDPKSQQECFYCSYLGRDDHLIS